MTAREFATAVPLRVWTSSFFFVSARRKRVRSRRAWKSVQLEVEVTSP